MDTRALGDAAVSDLAGEHLRLADQWSEAVKTPLLGV